ncbi:hypothetical protein TNIN_100381 [Trichonephila inaurata madagascariensis]|uniref:Uncharacterized protein n=1 Tax=Trichonephila inaurata madagascariensis TaxID=2747483 RepID=A0A8X7CHJ2_9ARAC|nr:hypothetical protein TNIN_100381 [Trichonephila inaurata madagascariensis]
MRVEGVICVISTWLSPLPFPLWYKRARECGLLMNDHEMEYRTRLGWEWRCHWRVGELSGLNGWFLNYATVSGSNADRCKVPYLKKGIDANKKITGTSTVIRPMVHEEGLTVPDSPANISTGNEMEGNRSKPEEAPNNINNSPNPTLFEMLDPYIHPKFELHHVPFMT